MVELTESNLQLLILITYLVKFYSAWMKDKTLVENFLFMLLCKREKKGEKSSIKLLENNGYKVLDEQIKLNGYFILMTN